jgi:hypothetical protein
MLGLGVRKRDLVLGKALGTMEPLLLLLDDLVFTAVSSVFIGVA